MKFSGRSWIAKSGPIHSFVRPVWFLDCISNINDHLIQKTQIRRFTWYIGIALTISQEISWSWSWQTWWTGRPWLGRFYRVWCDIWSSMICHSHISIDFVLKSSHGRIWDSRRPLKSTDWQSRHLSDIERSVSNHESPTEEFRRPMPIQWTADLIWIIC
jgi:hypothetical protein